jgi:CubicO group peptidase (beta-lactamase class C family)
LQSDSGGGGTGPPGPSYTYTSDPNDIVVQPISLFRIASLSKPLTSAAIFHLIQEGRLSLTTKLTDILQLTPPPGQTRDPRFSPITVPRLLQHLGGWDSNLAGFDPMFYDLTISGALGLSLPITKYAIATYMAGQPLQYYPGTTYAYCNFGYYSLLGQIIETITGMPYEQYVIKNILKPLGIKRMKLGRTLPQYRLYDEVKYHSVWTGPTVFDNSGNIVFQPYGSYDLENMDAHGGWLASAVDLVKFASIFDQPASCPILSPDSINTTFALPENINPANYAPGDAFYACGWSVRDYGSGVKNT